MLSKEEGKDNWLSSSGDLSRNKWLMDGIWLRSCLIRMALMMKLVTMMEFCRELDLSIYCRIISIVVYCTLVSSKQSSNTDFECKSLTKSFGCLKKKG